MIQGSATRPSLTARQRRELRDAGKALGMRGEVYAFALGRANARWSAGAQWIIALFGTAFIVVLMTLHVILIPGFLVAYLLYDSVRPRRGLAVTTAGIVELRLRALNGRPESVIGSTDHGALNHARVEQVSGRESVRVGDELVSVKKRELERLRAAAASAESSANTGGLPPPPPSPNGVAVWASDAASGKALPGWREATIGRVLGHLMVGLVLFVLCLIVANALGSALGRDIERTSKEASIYLWAVFGGAVSGWMLFVYWRGTFRTRMSLLAACTGGALLLCCVVNFVYSPPVPS
jgi:hypothetical protein